MQNRLTIVFSGKKLSGKTSCASFALAEFINKKIGKDRFSVSKTGREGPSLVDSFNNNSIIPIAYTNPALKNLTDTYSVKVYDFRDPLREFCVNSLGLDYIQCYGSDTDQDSVTHILWEDMFDQIREKYSRPRRGSGGNKPANGFMTAKEVMNVVENDIFRRIDANCWARSLYSMIHKDKSDLNVVLNASYPNEVTLGVEFGAKVIRLLKDNGKHHDDPLNEFSLGEYSLVIDNQNLTPLETYKKLKPHLLSWFAERKLV